MSEISDDMKVTLFNELAQDGQRIVEISARAQRPPKMEYAEERAMLEQMAYITEQQRLKLKILGAPRIYN